MDPREAEGTEEESGPGSIRRGMYIRKNRTLTRAENGTR